MPLFYPGGMELQADILSSAILHSPFSILHFRHDPARNP
jgi:hypothetical protein